MQNNKTSENATDDESQNFKVERAWKAFLNMSDIPRGKVEIRPQGREGLSRDDSPGNKTKLQEG